MTLTGIAVVPGGRAGEPKTPARPRMRAWCRRLRLFKAIELLGGGLSVTQTALEFGYSSPSAFTYAFRSEMGHSPQVHRRSLAGPAGAGSNGSLGS
jgi:AraC-like DNA-binding protein